MIVADEPVSALDVSVQAQVLTLLKDRCRTRARIGLPVRQRTTSRVIRWFWTRVAVMYLGRIVEQGSVADVFEHPMHPYTRMLCDASPIPDPARRAVLPRVIGEIPSAAAPPPRLPLSSPLHRRHRAVPAGIPALDQRVRPFLCLPPSSATGR